ncbi:MAG: hypothetical protein ACOCX5_00995 [Chloroflexota bacterium]
MTDQSEHAEQNSEYPLIDYVVVEKRPRAWYKRPGCLVGIVIWFLVMLLPFALFVLAIEGDITLSYGGDVPDKHAHPLLQVRLVMEPDYRGLSITTASLHREGEANLCIQNNIRFILWQGEGDPVTYCQCYARASVDDEWTSTDTSQGACP